MALTIPMGNLPFEVDVKDIASKLQEAEDGQLMLRMGFHLNVPINELLAALTSIQQKSQAAAKKAPPQPHPKSMPEAALAPAANLSAPALQSPPHPTPPPAPVPPAIAANSAPVAETTFAQPSAAEVKTPVVQATWDTPIEDLQQNYEEYKKKSRWGPEDDVARMRILDDKLLVLEKLTAQALNPPVLKPKVPSQRLDKPFDKKAQELIMEQLRKQKEDAAKAAGATQASSTAPSAGAPSPAAQNGASAAARTPIGAAPATGLEGPPGLQHPTSDGKDGKTGSGNGKECQQQ